MEFKCDVCSVRVHSQTHWDDHINGKAHQHNIEHKAKMDKLARRSVYLNNFAKQFDENEVAKAMDQFGEVERVVADRSGKNAFAIVEFKEEDAALNLVHSIGRIRIGKCNVRIHPRRVDFSSDKISQSFCGQNGRINSDEVLNVLNEIAAPDFNNQLSALVVKFSIAANTMNERAEFASKLNQFIQAFFSSTLFIRVFGSSSTGLGFVNSDLDLNLVFKDDLDESTNNGYVPSPSSTNTDDMDMCNKQLTSEELRQSPIDRATFVQLSKIERIRLLNRLVNAFRKEVGMITAHVPVPDARTPIVRFLLRLPTIRLPCELSVQNLLGECKANLIRDIVRAETTGTLWRMLFLLRLWFSCNGLFSPNLPLVEKKTKREMMEESDQQNTNHQPKSHWNSYTLSLLAITFLQQRGRIPPIQLLLRHNSRTIEGWPIEYDLSFFSLEEDFTVLLKDFFTFLYQNLNESHVFAPRDGRLLEKSDFNGRYIDEDKRMEKKWHFSLINVQDPLELSHNVAANVGKQYLAALRWKIMYGIAVLKRSPNDLRGLFTLDDPKQLQAERRAEKAQNREIKQKQQQNRAEKRKEVEPMDVDDDN